MLSPLGWVPGVPQPHRGSAEYTRGRGWLVARVWSTAGSFDSAPLRRGTTRIVLGVEGTATLRIGGDLVELAPRQMVAFDADTPASTENLGLWARCEWQLRSPALEQSRLVALTKRALPLRLSDYTLLTTMTNTLSTNDRFGSSHGTHLLGDALTSTAMAVMLNAGGVATSLSPTQTSLIDRAVDVIEDEYRDDSFTVTTLARRLSVSPDYLGRLFAATGTTARRAIEERRVAAAKTILSATPVRSATTLAEAARLSGFTTVRRMQEAIRRQQAHA